MNFTSFNLDNITIYYQGDHTGVASIAFDEIAIVSMGPHYFPLGELSRFGIYRDGEDLSDIEESKSKISGWTKLIACDRSFGSGATWMHFSAEKKEKAFCLRTRFENGQGEDPFAFVFFVKADEVRVEEKRIAKGSLANYQGINSSLELITRREKVEILINHKTSLQIIPLAGGDYFWGADFLVAFEITDLSMHYQWMIAKSI